MQEGKREGKGNRAHDRHQLSLAMEELEKLLGGGDENWGDSHRLNEKPAEV